MDRDSQETLIRHMLAETYATHERPAYLGRLPRLREDAADEAARSMAAFEAGEMILALDRAVSDVVEKHGTAGSAALWGWLGSREAVASSHIENEGTSLRLHDMHREIELLQPPSASTDDVQTGVAIAQDDWLAQEKMSVLRCCGASKWLFGAGVSIHSVLRAHEILCFGRTEVKPGSLRAAGENVSIYDRHRGVVFAPPKGGRTIKTMLTELIDWVADRCNNQPDTDDAIERYAYRVAVSGIAHLRFETIHPFRDGNGRVGRSFAEAIIASARPWYHHVLPIGIATAFSERMTRATYYVALNHGRDDQTEFATWWCERVQEAIMDVLEEITVDAVGDLILA